MQQIKLKKGLDIPMNGAAALTIGSINRPSIYKIVPDHYAGLTPKLMVKEGEQVKAGSPLFHDKQFAELVVTSPVSGTVVEINRGERRKVMYIGIQADTQTAYAEFDLKQNVKDLLLQSGLWAYIKQRPYDCIAMPSKQPKAIFVSTFDTAPLAPDYGFVLAGKGNLIQAGINALSQLAPVYVGMKAGSKTTDFATLQNCTLYSVSGPHPAGNVGVQINHVAPIAKGETVFTVNIQDLAIIGQFFTTGQVKQERLVALTGDMTFEPQYFRILPGTPASAITHCNVRKDVATRIICGNVLSGTQITEDESLCYRCNQVSILAEGTEKHEFMGWLLPRFNDFNAKATDPAKFLDNGLWRWLFGPKQYNWDARVKGGRRAIIVSGEYEKVFPMDIYPEQLIKAMIAGNIDKMEQLGAYEIAPEDFALCEYICTSKLPLQAIVKEALTNLKKEIE